MVGKRKYIKRRKVAKKRTTSSSVDLSGEKNRMQWPIPKSTRIVFRYNDFLKLTSTAGSTVSTQWRANSIYDPDYTYIGHQPYGYDQISGLYNSYCTIRCTIILRYTALTAAMRVVIEPRFNIVSLATDLQAVMERNQTMNFIAVPNETGYKKFSVYLPKLAGQSLVNYKQTCGAVPGTNPVVVTYFNLYAQVMDTALTGSLLLDYELHQDTIMEQPLVQNQS